MSVPFDISVKCPLLVLLSFAKGRWLLFLSSVLPQSSEFISLKLTPGSCQMPLVCLLFWSLNFLLWGQSLLLLPICCDPQCHHGHFKDMSCRDALVTSGQLSFPPGHFRVLAAALEQSRALDVLWRGLSSLSFDFCFSPNPVL